MIRRARFLVLRGGAIGDFVLTLPVLQALRSRWPDAYIELIGYPHIANLAVAAGLVDHVESLDRAGMAKFFTTRPSFTEQQAEHIRSFDIVFSFLHDPTEVVRENLRAAGARTVIYGSPIVKEGHAIEHLLKPLESLAIYESNAVPRLNLSESYLEKGRQWLANRGLNERPVAIHPGSGSPSKNWPLDRFLEIATAVTEWALRVFFILGEADESLGRIIKARTPQFPVLEQASLVDVAAVLSNCHLYLGNDSGITHIAAAVGIPVVALFGPTDPAQWGPRGPRVRILRDPSGKLENLATSSVLRTLRELL